MPADAKLRRLVLTLWHTAMLRLVRLRVADEVENGLAFFRSTFLKAVPELALDLDVVPLFETIGDLESAPAVLDALLANEAYARYLATRGCAICARAGRSSG